MPRLPRYIQQVIPTGGRNASAADFGGGEGLVAIGQALGQVEDTAEKLFRLDSVRKANAASVKASTELGNFALDLESDPDYDTHEERFNEYAEKVKAEASKDVRYRDVAKQLDTQMDYRIGQMGISVRKNAVSQMVAVGRADLSENLTELAAMGAKNPEAREETVVEGFKTISITQSLGFITPPEAAVKKSNFIKDVFLHEMDANPAIAESLIADIHDEDYAKHLDAQDIRALTNAARTTQANYEANLIAKDKAHIEAVQNDMLARHEAGELTPPQILASDLPAFGLGSKQTFLKMQEGTAGTDSSVFANTMGRVLSGSVQTADELLPLIGHGLTPANFMTLRGVLEDPLNSDMKRVLTGTKSMITGSTFSMVDPEGDRLFMEFTFVLNDALDEGEKAGKSRRAMLNPSSKDYIVEKVMTPYRRTTTEKVNSIVEGMRLRDTETPKVKLTEEEFLEEFQ